jgi:hypothetical protein
MDATEAVRTELTRRPWGSADHIAGHRFPADEGVDDAARIAALEDAVRALAATLMTLARQVDKRS